MRRYVGFEYDVLLGDRPRLINPPKPTLLPESMDPDPKKLIQIKPKGARSTTLFSSFYQEKSILKWNFKML